MTVHRVGPPPEEAPPHRTELGRVLVTIDDLAALKTFVTRSMAGMAADIKIEFDGGYFTEPEDLRTLSDAEMQSLRLETPKVQVVLNLSAAFVIGDRQEAEDVYRVWARARQTQLRARPIQFYEYLLFLIPIVLTVLLILGLIPGIDGKGDPIANLLVGMGIGMMGAALGHAVFAKKSSYAIVIPLSLAEHRQMHSTQKYPRRSWIVAIVSAVIAILAIAAVVWIKLTS